MQPIKKVFFFVLVSLLLYCIFSLAAVYYKFNFLSFNNVNLLGDVVVSDKIVTSPSPDSFQNKPADTFLTAKAAVNFENFRLANNITAFQKDTLQPSLTKFDAKLLALKQGKKVKIRIAYLGDSMIEGDLLTQTLRKLLQKMFGGYGVGFVPVNFTVGKFRTTATADFSNNWQDDNLKNASAAAKQTLFFSGHRFIANNSWAIITDKSAPDSMPLEKNLLCGYALNATINYNDKPFVVNAPNNFNRILLSTDYFHAAKISVNNAALPVYGISFESSAGIFVDNFSFRGVSGFEFNAIDSSFLKNINANNPYDLIILGYGVNVLFKPDDINFTWYKTLMTPVITKFKKSFPESDIIIIGTADRAFRYNGKYKSAVGIDSLIKIQAALAFDNGICFYNQFATMGGLNTIVKWANELPTLANKDYIHPNLQGSEILATYFYNAILNDYNKYLAAANAAHKTN